LLWESAFPRAPSAGGSGLGAPSVRASV